MSSRFVWIACAAAVACAVAPPSAPAGTHSLADPGSALGQVNDPSSLAITRSGELLVADSANLRIQRLTLSGTPISSFAVPSAGADRYGMYVAAGTNDDVWVAQAAYSGATDTLRHYSADGTQLGSWGSDSNPSPPGPIQGPRGVAVDGAGNVYVPASDPGGWQRIIKLSPTGDYLEEWALKTPAGTSAFGRAIAASGNVIAVVVVGEDATKPEVVRYDPGGNVLSRWEVGNAGAIALDAAGNVYTALAQIGNPQIQKFGPGGKPLGTFAVAAPDPPPSTECPQIDYYAPGTPLNFPPFTAVAVDPMGVAYAADQGDHVTATDGLPTVRLGAGPGGVGGWAQTGQVVALDAGLSTVAFGTPTKYEWDLDGDGTFESDTGETSRITTAFRTSGPHTVAVRVSGSRGGSAVGQKAFSVHESQAVAWSPGVSIAGWTVTFNANPSDMSCTSETYQWDLDGDGTFETNSGSTGLVTKVYSKVGSLTVHLRVIRAGGRIDELAIPHDVRPAPPSGPVGVTINNGARFTNDPVVQVNPVWPALTKNMRIANDGGFRPAQQFLVSPSQTWRLDSSGPERLPKTVYVRFDFAKGRTFTDDIILDEMRPAVTEATILDGQAAAARSAGARLRVRARDNASGLARMQIARSRSRPGSWLRMRRTRRVRRSDAQWVRVRDRAGNRSRWRRVR